MILPDTSIWIEFLKGSPKIFGIMRDQLEARNVVAVEWVFGELLQGARGHEEIGLICGYWESLPQIESEGLWIEAGKLAQHGQFYQKGIGLIDAAIIVAARRRRAKIWTLDKKLRRVLKEDEVIGNDKIT